MVRKLGNVDIEYSLLETTDGVTDFKFQKAFARSQQINRTFWKVNKINASAEKFAKYFFDQLAP